MVDLVHASGKLFAALATDMALGEIDQLGEWESTTIMCEDDRRLSYVAVGELATLREHVIPLWRVGSFRRMCTVTVTLRISAQRFVTQRIHRSALSAK